MLTVVFSLGLANNVRVESSSGKHPCELWPTNGLAMEKELYIESVGDAGSSGASKSCICVLKPPATWMINSHRPSAALQKNADMPVNNDIPASLLYLFQS